MKHKNAKKRLVSAVTLIAILLPIITLTAYAATYTFSFGFNGSTAGWYANGIKSNTSLKGSVTVASGDFGIGQVEFIIVDEEGISFTYTRTVSSTGTYTLNYVAPPQSMASNIARLRGQATNQYVWGCNGTFTP